MALGTYTEPRLEAAGVPFADKQQLPHGDVNQLITNQRNLWNQVRGSAQMVDLLYDARLYVQFPLTTTWETLYTNDGGSSDTLVFPYAGGQIANDLFDITVGPFGIGIGSSGTPAPTVEARVVITQNSVSVAYKRTIVQPIPGVATETPLEFPILYKSSGTTSISLKVEARLKISTTCNCSINTPGATTASAGSDVAYGNTPSFPTLHQWLIWRHYRRAPL